MVNKSTPATPSMAPATTIATKMTVPHLTVRLALELMAVECVGEDSDARASTDAAAPPAQGADAIDVAGEMACLRAAALAASCPGCNKIPLPSGLALYSTVETPWEISTASPGSSDECSTRWNSFSLGEEGEDLEDFIEDRGRLEATVGAGAASTSMSLNDRFSNAVDEWRYREQSSADPSSAQTSRESSTLDELNHPALTGAMAAVHGYAASGGDLVFLEKAYDLARRVAASKHDLTVAFNACRIALAVGYVFTFRRGSIENARMFALHHSLPKLALSLEPFWSRRVHDLSSREEKLEWEECMMSLLEVSSSIALLADDKAILSALDPEAQTGVAEAIGLFCALNPKVLCLYPDVGRPCKRMYLSSLRGDEHEYMMAALKQRESLTPLGAEHRCLEDSE